VGFNLILTLIISPLIIIIVSLKSKTKNMNTILIPVDSIVIVTTVVKKKDYTNVIEAIKTIKQQENDPSKRSSSIVRLMQKTKIVSLQVLQDTEFDEAFIGGKIALKDDEIFISEKLEAIKSINI